MTHILTDVTKLLKRRVRILQICFGNLWGFLITDRLHDIGMFAGGSGQRQPGRARNLRAALVQSLDLSLRTYCASVLPPRSGRSGSVGWRRRAWTVTLSASPFSKGAAYPALPS